MVISIFAALLAGASATPVTIEIVTSGHIETPADRYRLSGSLLACAATQAEADALLAQKKAAIERSMAALGVTPAAVSGERPTLIGMMGGLMSARTSGDCNKSGLDDLVIDAEAKASKPEPDKKDRVGASASLSYDARDRGTAMQAIAALKAAEAKPADVAIPVLLDETPARRAAKQQALAKARVEAEAYAGPLGAGPPVLFGISERQDFGSIDFLAQMMRTIGLPGTASTDKVVTDITLTVQFRVGGR